MYEIQAVIGDRNVIQMGEIPWTRFVDLSQGKVMIPFTNKFINEMGIPYLPFAEGDATTLPFTIAKFCQLASSSGKIAYIEAFFFGGQGTQACSLWNTGIVLGEPRVGLQSINIALRFLGTKRDKDLDEFDTLNLGKFRKTEDWLAET
jgi:hypothetical protein